jgi:hypothetical protein
MQQFSIDSIACCLTTVNSFSTTFTGTLTITFDPSSNVTSTFAVKLSEIDSVDGVSNQLKMRHNKRLMISIITQH